MHKTILKIVAALLLLVMATILSITINFEKMKDKSNKLVNKEENEDEFGFNLPVVVIDVGNGKLNRDEKIKGSIKIYNRGEEKSKNYLSDDPEIISDILIKIRGNSSANYPKLQYSIELLKENGEKRDKKLLGMAEDSDWVLNGPFADKSLIRNYLAYTVSDKIMDYAPKAKFCEVFVVDGSSKNIKKSHYKGLYLMTEKIKIGKKKVNIHETHKNSDETSFIASKDRIKNDIDFKTYGKQTFLYDYGVISTYPKKNITEKNIEYINKTISEFERALYGNKFNNLKEGYRKYIDENSFIDYYIINEFFQNTDAGVFSFYFHKDYGEKIKAGPVWDFNIAMGNNKVTGNYYIPNGFYMNQTSWFDRLLEDKLFVTSLIGRYRILRNTYLSDEYLTKTIDEAVKEIGPAKDRNFSIWPMELCNESDVFIKYGFDHFKDFNNNPEKLVKYFKDNPKMLEKNNRQAKSYEEEITKLKKFIVDRGKWMDDNIEKLYKWTK